jgi:hypothetical protein
MVSHLLTYCFHYYYYYLEPLSICGIYCLQVLEITYTEFRIVSILMAFPIFIENWLLVTFFPKSSEVYEPYPCNISGGNPQ